MTVTKASFGGGGSYEERAVGSPHPDDLRSSQTVTMKKKGKPTVTFQKGGLHQSLGVPEGEKIPADKMAAAQAGKYGPKAQKQANFAQGMLKAGRKTAAKKGGK